MANQLQWINALSTCASLEAAVTEVVSRVKQSLSGTPDLGIVFISSAYASEYPRLVPLLLEKLPLAVLIGCGGGGIIGMDSADRVREIEGKPALSLCVAHLPEVEIQPFHILAEKLPDLDSSPQAWADLVGVSPSKQPQFILLSDPFSSRINDLLAGLDFAYPGSVKVGGLASTAPTGINSGLFYYHQDNSDEFLYKEGTIGVALSGKVALDAIVAQGCRPIGKPYQINQGERNIVLELSDLETGISATPLELLRNLMQDLSESDRMLAQNSLFVGIARDEFKLNLQQGDFLIRNLLGVDPRLGAIAIGDRIRAGQRLQFHLRDARTSAEDLEMLLNTYQKNNPNSSPVVGALLFSCLGRGEGLYQKPNFDSEMFRRHMGAISLGGFFCNGEIGPVGNTTFLHGYTSAFAILRQL